MKFSGKSAAGGAASGAAAGSVAGPWGAVIGAGVGGIAGGIAGGQAEAAEEEAKKRALERQKAALRAIEGLEAPQYDKVNFGQMGGDYKVNSEWDNIQSDPNLKAKQMSQLSALDEIQKSGGMTAGDRANWNKLQMDVNSADAGRRGAIQQGMAMRGMASSGNSLLAQLQGAQDATNTQSQASGQVAGMAQQRALDAMMRSGQLAGDIRGQDFSENAARATAKDSISRFNTTNSMDQDRFNIGQSDKQQMYVNEMKSRSFDDQYKIAMAIAQANGLDAQFAADMAKASAAERGQIMEGMFKVGAAVASNYGDKDKK
jgi:hypothetical protein